MWILLSVKKWCVSQTAGLQRDPPPVLQPAPALTVFVGVVFCASLGPCACTMLCVRMAFPSDGGSLWREFYRLSPDVAPPHTCHPGQPSGLSFQDFKCTGPPCGVGARSHPEHSRLAPCPKTCAPQTGGGLSSVGEECAGSTYKKYCRRRRSKLLTTRQPESGSPVAPEYFPDHSAEHVGCQYTQMVKRITQKSIVKKQWWAMGWRGALS